MRRIKRLLAFALCLWSAPALAGFTQVSGSGTNGAIFNTIFVSGTSGGGVTTATLNIGDIAVLSIKDNNAPSTRTYSCAGADGLGNTWQAAPGGGSQANAGSQLWYSKLTVGIPSGTTLTCSNSVTGGFLLTAVAARPAGTAAFDTNATVALTSGVGTVTVGPTPTLACPSGAANCEFCVAQSEWSNAGTTASDASFITTGGTGAGAPWTDAIKFASATTALSYTATNTQNASIAASLACFKDTPAAGVTKRLMMRSVP